MLELLLLFQTYNTNGKQLACRAFLILIVLDNQFQSALWLSFQNVAEYSRIKKIDTQYKRAVLKVAFRISKVFRTRILRKSDNV